MSSPSEDLPFFCANRAWRMTRVRKQTRHHRRFLAHSKNDNLEKKQRLGSSNSLPCSFTCFCSVADERPLCLSGALLISLCHSNGERREPTKKPVCLHTVNTNAASLFVKHTELQPYLASVSLVLLNSWGREYTVSVCSLCNINAGQPFYWVILEKVLQSIPL